MAEMPTDASTANARAAPPIIVAMSDRQDEGVNDVIARPPLEDHHNHNHHATRNPPSDRCRVSRHASGGSDEYAMDAHHHQEVEISFLPAKLQSHRRKSSMVDAGHDSHGTDCFVHQFIDSHRRPKRGPPSSGTPSSATASTHGQTSPSPSSAATTIAASPVEHDSGGPASLSPLREEGGATPEPPQRCGGFGQADEKEWAGHMMARSKMTMLVPGGHPGGEESVAAAIGEDGSDDAHSRLLTKRQLNEMVWGVRELGRRLGNMKVRFTARSILILTKIHDEDLIPLTRELAGWLLSDGDRGVCYTVYVDERLRENRRFDADGLLASIRPRQETTTADGDLSTRLRYWTADMCRSKPHLFDFVITLGGDGTVLYTSWLFQRIVPPVLSFSLGSLGFLSKFDFADYRDTLTTALTKGVTISLRLRFEGTIMRSQPRRQTLQDGEEGAAEDGTSRRRRDLVEELIGEEHDGDDHTHRPDATYEILNEIVVDRGPNPTLSNLEIFGDDEHFTSVLADGICVSTPTGSTAYNLASGGSLCHPDNPVMMMTAICAHTLSFRPLVLPDTIVLRVGVPYSARTTSWASFDGRERVELLPGDYVTISASRYPFACVQSSERNRGEDWVNSISHKLGWNTRQKQKEFKEW